MLDAAPRLLVLRPGSLDGEDHGVLVQHVTTLTTLLEGRGWTVESLDLLHPRLGEAVGDADLVVVSMLAAQEVEAIIRARRRRGLPTVFEVTDNPLGLGGWAGPEHSLRSPLIRQRLLYHAWLADALQVYSAGLAQLLDGVNPRIVRFDPYVPIPETVPAKKPGFVVGWAGTRSHAAGLAAAAPAVVTFCRRHPDVTFSYMGDRGVFDEHFGGIPAAQVRVRPFGTHDEYLRHLAELHVGIGPLAPTGFDAARTDTRMAAYAAHGVAAVLQDRPPYRRHAARARLFGDGPELERALETLHRDRGQVLRLAAAGRAWVQRRRDRDALAAQRDEAYRSLLTGGASRGRPAEERARGNGTGSALAARLRSAAGGGPEEALAATVALLAADPGYEQARWLAARSLERLGRGEEALAHAALLAGTELYGDLAAELRIRVRRRLPQAAADDEDQNIESPFLRLRLATSGSSRERARTLLDEQPYDYFALFVAIRALLEEDPSSPELDELYARACLVAPESVPPDRRPARLAPFLPA